MFNFVDKQGRKLIQKMLTKKLYVHNKHDWIGERFFNDDIVLIDDDFAATWFTPEYWTEIGEL